MSGQLPGAATHHLLHPLRVVVDLGHVLPQDPPGDLLRRGRAAATQQFQPLWGSLRLQHQRLVDVAHAHALGDGVPEALVGGGGVWGMGRWWRGETVVALEGRGIQASQAAMSARDRLRPAPPPGVPTSGGGKVTV